MGDGDYDGPQHPGVHKSRSFPASPGLGRLRDVAPALSRGPGDYDTKETQGERGGGSGDIKLRDGQGCDVTGLAFARGARSVRKGAQSRLAAKSQAGPGEGVLVEPGGAQRWASPDSSPPGAASTSGSRLPHLPPPP